MATVPSTEAVDKRASPVSGPYAVDILLDEQPETVAKFGVRHVSDMATRILASEIAPASKEFGGIYREFNEKYFSNGLPHYRVRVAFGLHTLANEPVYQGGVSAGLIRFQERCIYLRYTLYRSMEETLIHEMAHAATNGDHGEEWLTEMRRLKDAGAPVPDWGLAGRSGS